jgi:rare lipoprotein A
MNESAHSIDGLVDEVPPDPPDTLLQQGLASWYGGKRWHGRLTASGERFDRAGLTAAHLTLPLDTRVRVLNLGNGREVWVRINDRGPFSRKYIIDLSEAAADRLGMRRAGRARVVLHTQAR